MKRLSTLSWAANHYHYHFNFKNCNCILEKLNTFDTHMKWQRYLAWEDTELLSFGNCVEGANHIKRYLIATSAI